MNTKLQAFINQNTDKIIGDTPENIGECVGLVECWTDVLQIPHEYGNAKDLLANADTNFFDVVLNSADNVPMGGDIVVWGTQVGELGHTALFTNGDADTFYSFDQNWPLKTSCHIQKHNYSGVLGWLHPKVVQSQQPIMPPYLATLFQEQKIDFTQESAVRAFFQQAIDYPNLKTDHDNCQRQLTNLAGRVNDLTVTNNMQADVIGHLNQDIAALRNQVPAPTPPPAKPSFWEWLKELFR